MSNVVEPVLKLDTQLREQMRQDLGGLPAVPEQAETTRLSSSKSPARPTPGEPSLEAPPFLPAPRDAQLVELETHLRLSVRDAVNRASRKPFHWGGLAGYQQLEEIALALHGLPAEAETV